MGRKIIISDLHIDTWTKRPVYGKPKHEHFFNFLEWCEWERSGVEELIINGDTMNMPPYLGHLSLTNPRSITNRVLERLGEFAERKRLTVVWGNHDIGLSGLRVRAEDNIGCLRNVNFCYPTYVLYYPGRTILMEHGHMVDPVLWLYAAHWMDKTYHFEKLEEFYWALQRKNSDPGIIPPVEIPHGGSAYQTVIEDQRSWEEQEANSLWKKLFSLWKRSEPVARTLMREYWWGKAVGCVEAWLQCSNKYVEGEVCQIFGHTHRADVRQTVAVAHEDSPERREVQVRYANSGTWIGSSNLGNYLDVDETGRVWVQDWVNEPEGIRRLDGTQG